MTCAHKTYADHTAGRDDGRPIWVCSSCGDRGLWKGWEFFGSPECRDCGVASIERVECAACVRKRNPTPFPAASICRVIAGSARKRMWRKGLCRELCAHENDPRVAKALQDARRAGFLHFDAKWGWLLTRAGQELVP